MNIGILKETFPGERRVAITPAVLSQLSKVGVTAVLEPGAGVAAGYPDAEYTQKGARLAGSRSEVFSSCEILAMVRTYGANQEAGKADLALLGAGKTVIGSCDPLGEPEAAREFAATGANLLSLELMPRITRAQSMDILSSMATIAGYKAVLLAANHLPKMFPMMMTAAGTIKPAKVFIIGAGVAGLQAISSARKLGAVVVAYDVRPAVKEQIESLGGKFVEMPLETADAEDAGGYAKDQGEDFIRKQRELMAKVVAENDVVITTAAIPGRKSPVLVTADMVKGMQPGSVIIDLAAERGGNCELTRADEIVVEHGVTILGPINLPAEIPFHASQMYSKNLTTFLLHLIDKEGNFTLNTDDEITAGTLVTQGGKVVHPRVLDLLGQDSGAGA
ncbi:MAG: Re/Si-specific NAD(P)(+) transhydrogenase subunit alpha [Acidobacteria bacterium]|uniref:NAD(P) transhydrogenase subunit alpha part 1 n=1 Tax=Candidatus Polarisedimenticola svalbardensis TaxID=2886004 RepID=A0A8J7CE20_9BACT|nr:Re/Si-specific NAD(P)(+) transhydrogenase subunit alpha [Candidatus Polarisedimenticola svalbardensis]